MILNFLGDLNKDCVVDIIDAALVQTYTRESVTSFTTTVGLALSTDLAVAQKTSMDVDKNGVVDYHDAMFMRDVLAGYSKLISSFTVQAPAAPSCDLIITASLKNVDQTAATNTRAFVILSYKDNTLNTELIAAGLSGTTSYTLGSGAVRYGKVYELAKTSSGSFEMKALKPKITKNNVGVTLVTVVATSSGSRVASTFRKPANVTGSKKAVTLTSGLLLDVYDSFRPQKTVNFTTSGNLCQGQMVTRRLQLKFNAAFSLITGKEAKFISNFKTFFENKYRTATREVIASNITVRAGSIIVDFDVTMFQSQEAQFTNDISNDVKTGLLFTFDGNNMVASQTLKIDGKEQIPPPKPAPKSNKILIIIIVVVVVVLLIFIAIVAYCCYRKKRMNAKKVKSFEMDDLRSTSSYSNDKLVSATPGRTSVASSKKSEFVEVSFKNVNVPSTVPSRMSETETAFYNDAYQGDDQRKTPSPHADDPLLAARVC